MLLRRILAGWSTILLLLLGRVALGSTVLLLRGRVTGSAVLLGRRVTLGRVAALGRVLVMRH